MSATLTMTSPCSW